MDVDSVTPMGYATGLFRKFLIVDLIVHFMFLAVDSARTRESQAREYEMDVDSKTTMGCARGMFLTFIIVDPIVHLIVSFPTAHRSIAEHPSPIHRPPIVDSVLRMNELGNDRESRNLYSII
jgi:hypothetical protein